MIKDLVPESLSTIEFNNNVDIEVDSIIRCPLNATENSHCYPALYSTSNTTNEKLFTLCPKSYDEWHFLWIACVLITCLLFLSLLSVMLLHHLIDVEKRMMLFRKIKIDTCPQRDASVKQYMIEIMEKKNSFEDINEKAMQALGKPMIELMVQSKRLHITKVCFQFFISM